MIELSCPGCAKVYSLPDDKAGRTGRCRDCGTSFKVPDLPIRHSSNQVEPIGIASPEPPPRTVSGLGVAAVVIGLFCLVLGIVPFLGLLTFPLALLGGILAFVGLVLAGTSRRHGFGWPIVGLILNAGAMILVVVMTIQIAQSMRENVLKAQAEQARVNAERAKIDAEREAKIKAKFDEMDRNTKMLRERRINNLNENP